jgi:phosphate/sulfate permease
MQNIISFFFLILFILGVSNPTFAQETLNTTSQAVGALPEISVVLWVVLIFSVLAACAFEFVNGFHDTANAVATVIYTNSLRPAQAVIWSGFWNFVGVFAGGIAVAMGIIKLFPMEILLNQNTYQSLSMILSILFTAILWNLGTWYFGIPASSSHTLIGSILGAVIAFSTLPGNENVKPNWEKATDVGLSLLISPLFGFSMAIILMFLFRRLVTDRRIFKHPEGSEVPPTWIRIFLIFTCTSVSFFHGSNDGQKGVGLIMLILISIVPGYYAINANLTPTNYLQSIKTAQTIYASVDTSLLALKEKSAYRKSVAELQELETLCSNSSIPFTERFNMRRDVILLAKNTKSLIEGKNMNITPEQTKQLGAVSKSLQDFTDYAPFWVLLAISLSLGLGTTVGWKRIVVTVGEKIGKQHLSYAQGASAELVAASTIGISTYLGLPVSTTHVLSSGIAGSMVARKGIKNLQPTTVRNILLAWVLTLPVTMGVSGGLYLMFHYIFQ